MHANLLGEAKTWITTEAEKVGIEIPFPFFYCFFHESQSQSTKSHFPASKKGKSQLPFPPSKQSNTFVEARKTAVAIEGK